MWRPSANRKPLVASGQLSTTSRLFLGLGAALFICGCQVSSSLDEIRTDFLALRYLEVAEDGASARPVNRARIISSTDRALALAPEHPLVLPRAGLLYMIAQAYDQAIPALLKAQRITGADYQYELGTCHLYSGQTDQGIALLEQALQRGRQAYYRHQLGPLAYATLLNNIGYAYADVGVQLPRAQHLITQAQDLAPLIASFTDSLGWVYFRLGDYHNAAFYLERAVRQSLDSPNAEIHYHLGTTYARQNRLPEARQQLQEALELRPRYSEALEELERLSQQLSPSWRVDASGEIPRS